MVKGKKETRTKHIFPVPFTLEKMSDTIFITTNRSCKLSKEEIIQLAYKFHSKGIISEAMKYYQYFIAKGFTESRMFSNYGAILKDLGEFKKAEIVLRRAIELQPDFADAHFNLGITLNNLGKIEEAELEERKWIDISFINKIDTAYKSTCMKYLNKSKSQFRQDLFALSKLNFKKKGFFVEFGACDGLIGSNSYLLEKYFNWNGILAEPGVFWHSKLKQSRAVNIETNCVWKSSDEKVLFNETENYKQLSTIDSFSRYDYAKQYRNKGNKYKVKTISLLDLLQKYNAPKSIDYLSIDTEGSEYEILKSFDFNQYEFQVITCEHNFSPLREKINNILKQNGYKRVLTSISREDDWYLLNK